MKNKSKKLTEADVIIVNRFGNSVKEMYADDYNTLKNIAENIKAEYEKSVEEEASRVFKKLKPKFDEYRSFVKSQKELEAEVIAAVKEHHEPSMADKILAALSEINEAIGEKSGTILKGVDNLMQDLFSPISLVLMGSMLAPVTAGKHRGAAKQKVQIYFKAEQERTGYLIASEGTVNLEIECKNDGKIFYLIGRNVTVKTNPKNGIVTFQNIEPGFYMLSEDLKWYKGIAIRADAGSE